MFFHLFGAIVIDFDSFSHLLRSRGSSRVGDLFGFFVCCCCYVSCEMERDRQGREKSEERCSSNRSLTLAQLNGGRVGRLDVHSVCYIVHSFWNTNYQKQFISGPSLSND